MIEWINLASLVCSYVLFGVFYTLSVQPMKRKEWRGDRAWKECARFRLISGFIEEIPILNDILWIWFPVSALDWKINPNGWVGVGIFAAIIIPGAILLIKGVKDAGKETMVPSPDSKPYGGIYKYIRHPQSLGEFPMFVAFGFLVNSWFLVLVALVFVLVYPPIMVFYEEKDLLKRFGKRYEEYRKSTGAIFPKRRKNG